MLLCVEIQGHGDILLLASLEQHFQFHTTNQWLGAVRQQAITWANVDPDLCRHMVSLAYNELKLH